MLYQLIGKEIDFGYFAENKQNQMDPAKVLALLAKGENKSLKDMTIFILVDGIQELPHIPKQPNSIMKRAIDSVSSLINAGSAFVIGVIAGTFYSTVADTFSFSAQLRISLPLQPIDGHKIIQNNDPLIQQFIDDMGGHGRALETLYEELKELESKGMDFSNYPPTTFMNDIKTKIQLKYKPLCDLSSSLVPALIAVIVRKKLNMKSEIDGLSKTVEDLVSMGLFRWKPIEDSDIGYLDCPFVLVWLLATWSGNPIFSQFKLPAYDDEQQRNMNPELPTGLQCWQNWEEFIAQFRILKSQLLKGKKMKLSELHSGALWGKDGNNLEIQVDELKGFVRASHQYDTRSGK